MHQNRRKAVMKLSVVAQYIRSDSSIIHYTAEVRNFPNRRQFDDCRRTYGNVVWSVSERHLCRTEKQNFYDREVFELITNKDIAQGVMELYLGRT
jgi:hypothetical protein